VSLLRFSLDDENAAVAYVDPTRVVAAVEKRSRQASGAYVDVTRLSMVNGEVFQVYGHVASAVAAAAMPPEPIDHGMGG
jgi:hypothetical protein